MPRKYLNFVGCQTRCIRRDDGAGYVSEAGTKVIGGFQRDDFVFGHVDAQCLKGTYVKGLRAL